MKDTQFYPTPWRVAEQAAALFKGPGGLLLEPSAGHGDLLKHLEYNRRGQSFKVKCVEIDPDNVAVLRAAGRRQRRCKSWDLPGLRTARKRRS